MKRHRLLIVLGAFLSLYGAAVAYQWTGDNEACDSREVTSVMFDRCMELRREARFGPLGAGQDIDSIVQAIKGEGSYPPPPYAGPAPETPDTGAPTQLR